MKIIFLICTNPSLEHLKNTHKRIQLTIAITTWYTLFKVQISTANIAKRQWTQFCTKYDQKSRLNQFTLAGADWPSGEFPVAWQPIWPAALHFFFYYYYFFFFIYILLLLLFCCLPNVLKWLFPNSPFNNKTHVIYREWVSLDWQRDSPRARSAPPRVRQKDASL